jgi:hypothetical protein
MKCSALSHCTTSHSTLFQIDLGMAEVISRVELPFGIVKEVLVAGSGPLPSKGDEIVAHYTGKLENGTTFDSSVTRKAPFKVRIFVFRLRVSTNIMPRVPHAVHSWRRPSDQSVGRGVCHYAERGKGGDYSPSWCGLRGFRYVM